jgi:hypothetical protein
MHDSDAPPPSDFNKLRVACVAHQFMLNVLLFVVVNPNDMGFLRLDTRISK